MHNQRLRLSAQQLASPGVARDRPGHFRVEAHPVQLVVPAVRDLGPQGTLPRRQRPDRACGLRTFQRLPFICPARLSRARDAAQGTLCARSRSPSWVDDFAATTPTPWAPSPVGSRVPPPCALALAPPARGTPPHKPPSPGARTPPRTRLEPGTNRLTADSGVRQQSSLRASRRGTGRHVRD